MKRKIYPSIAILKEKKFASASGIALSTFRKKFPSIAIPNKNKNFARASGVALSTFSSRKKILLTEIPNQNDVDKPGTVSTAKESLEVSTEIVLREQSTVAFLQKENLSTCGISVIAREN